MVMISSIMESGMQGMLSPTFAETDLHQDTYQLK
jgi:hypothetical protein